MGISIASLLRAAYVLSGQTQQDLAVESLLRQSRLHRILAGRTPPTAEEVRSILAATGADPLTSHRLHRSWSVSSVLLGLLLSVEKHQGAEIDKKPARLLIDKLSLTFNTTDLGLLIEILDQVAVKAPAKRRGRNDYEHRFQGHGVFVETGPPHDTRRDSRLEFNPAKQRDGAVPLIREVLNVAQPSTVRVSQIDVAVDLDVPFRTLHPLGASNQKVNVFIGPTGLETIYIGQREGTQLAVYDRDRRLLDTGQSPDGYATRFELRRRNLVGGVEALIKLRNPFASLRIATIPEVGGDEPLGNRLVLGYARTYGLDAVRAQMNRAEREWLQTRVKVIEGWSEHPAAVFERAWPTAITPLLKSLGFAK